MSDAAKPKRHRVKRDALPIHEHRRFRCPKCNGLEFKLRSVRDSDGASTQWRTCCCGYRFILIVE